MRRDDPAEGDLRLAGGGRSNGNGRLEIYLSGQWGTVCNDGFDDVDATVACLQLNRVLYSRCFGASVLHALFFNYHFQWNDDIHPSTRISETNFSF